MKTKFFALFLMVAMMFSAVPAGFAATDKNDAATEETTQTAAETVTTSAFKDLAADHVHSEAIKYLTEKKVIEGYEDGTFKPDNTITRAEFVKMLSVFAGWDKLSVSSVITGFSDVDATDEDSQPHWANKHIKAAVDNKIVNGMGDGTFMPDAPVKYEQVVKMLVCYLGYEETAKGAAELEKKELWPDGYLIQGNKLLISKNATLAVGDDAPRSAVAQMIYNIKDTAKIATLGNNIIPSVPSITGGGGGVGGSFSGETMTKWERIESGMSVSGVKIKGYIVSAIKELTSGAKIITCIDKNAEGLLTNNTKKEYFIAKCEKEVNGSQYLLFKGTGSGYTDLIGHDAEITFDFYDDVFSVTKIVYDDREYNRIEEIDASRISESRTREKIKAGESCLVYRDPETEKYTELPMPTDYSDIYVMYNDILVGAETVETDDGNGGKTQTPTSVTLEDFIINNGTIRVVTNSSSGKSFGGGQYDVIFVETYDTYVAKTTLTPGVPRKLTDKYRKDESGNALTVDIYEKGENGTLLEIAKANDTSDKTYTLSHIAANNIVRMKRSLGGKYTYIEFSATTTKSRQVVAEVDSGSITLGTSSYVVYDFSDYYKKYVASEISIENDMIVTVYLSGDGEVMWLTVPAISFSTGYIVSSEYEKGISSGATMKISFITSGNPAKRNTYTVTENTKFNGVACSQLSDDELGKGVDYVYNWLIKNAAAINEGKSVVSAEASGKITSQPFMFSASGSNFTHIQTISVDEENRLTNENRKELMYFSGSAGKQFKDGNTGVYTISSSAVLIFVPNDRTGYGESSYAMGTASALSSKLIPNRYYYVEPYYRPTTNADGTTGKTRDLFVIYYEDIDKKPRYYNDNVVVEELKLNATTRRYDLKVLPGTQGSGSLKFEVFCASGGDVNESIKAYVLDENFERLKDRDGNYIKRTVEAGDVVRFGKLPDGRILNMELVFDISENIAERKYGLYTANKKLDIADFADFELITQLFAQVGLVKGEFDKTATEASIKLTLGDNASGNGFIWTPNSTEVHAYDFTIEETDKFSDEIKTVKDINTMTDMIYVNQIQKNNSLTTSYIYVVRYNEDLQAKYKEYKDSLSQ